MTSNKFLSLLIAVLAIVIIALIYQSIRVGSLQGELKETKRDLNKKDKQLGFKIDSLQALRQEIAAKEERWIKIMTSRKDSLVAARQQANLWRNRYNNDKNGPIIPYTPAELDSVISAIIR